MAEPFWAKVLFREFIAHFIALNSEERAKDIEQSLIALTRLDSSGSSFGSKMVKWSEERMNGSAAKASAENGKMGGRPPTKDPSKRPPGIETMPRQKTKVIDYAIEQGLDVDDAVECWEATEERKGKDADGNLITNWKGFVTSWCMTRQTNRKLKRG